MKVFIIRVFRPLLLERRYKKVRRADKGEQKRLYNFCWNMSRDNIRNDLRQISYILH